MTLLSDLQQKKHLSMSDLKSSDLWDNLQKWEIAGCTNPRQILYHYETNNPIPSCFCGQELAWNSDKRQYRQFCSRQCTALGSQEKIKSTNYKKYGVQWGSQRPNFKSLIHSTSTNKFGVSHYSQTSEFKSRCSTTCMSKFGSPHASQSQPVKLRTQQQFIEKYGVPNPMKLQSVKDKLADSIYKKYGVENYAQSHYTPDTVKLLSDDTLFISECSLTPVMDVAKKYGISTNPIYAKARAIGFKIPWFNQSGLEREVLSFINSIYHRKVIVNDRVTISPQQIDVVLPDVGLAFECNGSYWHSELNGRGQNYHLQKLIACAAANLRLIHIWEHDWYQRPDIVKSMLTVAVGAGEKISARRCTVASVPSQDAAAFLNLTHLQGFVPGRYHVGLYFNNTLVSVMSVGKPRFKTLAQWEILRFASALNTVIVGGASKLLTSFIRTLGVPTTIVSYCDQSHSTGKVYAHMGFTLSHYSRPNYKYTKNYQTYFSRNKFQKHKLADLLDEFDPALSEWGNMKNNQWDRIWDCGNAVWIWSNQNCRSN